MRYFYVSVIDGSRKALLAGPYDSHESALAQVDTVRARAIDLHPRAHFYSFGTAGADQEYRTKFGKVGDILA